MWEPPGDSDIQEGNREEIPTEPVVQRRLVFGGTRPPPGGLEAAAPDTM